MPFNDPRDKRDHVPLLLSEFPAPPSFIPPSPYTPLAPSASNPPLSLPPSSPLPPLPGPSPITEHDTLLFMSAARSRRTSKLSLASSSSYYSKRDSTATLASIGSNASLPSLSPSVSITPLDSSSRSLRSSPSNGSLSVPSRHIDSSPALEHRRCEDDPAHLTRVSLDDLALHAALPEHDLSDDERVLDYGIAPSLSRRRPHSGGPPSPRELPTVQEDDPDPSRVPSPSSSRPASTPRPRTSGGLLAQQLPARIDKALPPLPADAASPAAPRADSPDIPAILATTPRPRRTSASSARAASRARAARPALRRHASEGVGAGAGVDVPRGRTAAPARRSPSELPYAGHAGWDDDDDDDAPAEDYGAPLGAAGAACELDGDAERALERQLEGEGSDSDSGLDVRTPLPHLMLRDGLLSPNSKLLAQAQTVLHPQILPNSRPGSMFSVVSAAGSVMTKSGIFKDERDTVRRRHRHRDGKLLRGGIGLTTGLGWSDSEDEDAPSPLTRRLSSRTLSAAARASPHPLARSVSDTLSSAGPGPSKYAGLHAVERRTSSSSVASSAGLRSRSSVSSLRSASSAAPRTGVRFPLGHINEREEALETASETSSLSMPVTPSASAAAVPPRLRKASAESSVRAPYAAPRLRKSSAESSVHSPLRLRKSSAESSAHSPLDSSNRSDGHAQDQLGASPALRASVPRPLRLPQAQASGRYHSTPARPSQPPSSYAPAPGPQRTRTYSGGLQRPQHHAPPASPVPARAESAPSTKPEFSPVSSSSASATSSPSISSPAHSASLPSLARQKPRTGTGMAYRTSSNPTLRPTMMRMPSSSALRASATKGVGVAL